MEFITNYSKCAITYNGKVLDRLIKGYSTVNVGSRQLYSPTLNTNSISSRDGDFVVDKKYQSKDIEVFFILYAPNNREFLNRIKYLNMLLQSTKDVKFYFDDEEGYRLGQFSKFNDPAYDSNFTKGSFTIHCSNPYLYFDDKEEINTVTNLKYSFYGAEVISYTCKVVESTEEFIIRNKKRNIEIILNNDFKKDDEIMIKDLNIYINGKKSISSLDYTKSDIVDFGIIYNDEAISTNQNSDVKILYRERVL